MSELNSSKFNCLLLLLISRLSAVCKCDLKYKKLSVVDINLFPQLKLIFIFTKYDASDVIFVTTTDDVYGFGSNKYGRIGLGHNKEVSEPTIITELCAKDVKNVEFGQQSMVALTESLDVYTCGNDYGGMLGNGQNTAIYRKPQKINLVDKLVVDMKCCLYSTYLVTDTKEIYYFGYRPNIGSAAYTPTLVSSLDNLKITAISCGSDHTLALTDTGKVYSWGLNSFGQLGFGHRNNTVNPTLILMSDNVFVKKISCGNSHSILLTTDGEIYSFGYNSCGQLGTGDTINQLLPKLMESKTKFNDIFAFDDISMALNQNRNVLIWGKAIVSSPFQTSVGSFQEAINTLSPNPFTYKPLSPKEIFNNKRVNRMMKTMTKAFNNFKNSDLKFKLKRKGSEEFDYIYGHKWIIEENCEYFERMFANKYSESESNEIQINGYSYESYYQFLRCLYTDSIETEDIELLIEMLAITDQYLDKEMKFKCLQSIKPLMNVQNVCSLYSSSLRNRCPELQEYCFRFMSRNISSVATTEDYEKMDDKYAKHFLTKYSQQK